MFYYGQNIDTHMTFYKLCLLLVLRCVLVDGITSRRETHSRLKKGL